MATAEQESFVILREQFCVFCSPADSRRLKGSCSQSRVLPPSFSAGGGKKKSKKRKNLLMFKFLWNGKSSNFEFRKSCRRVLHLDWNFVLVPHLAGCLKTEARTALPGSSVLVNRLWSWFLCLVFSILHSEWFCCTLESTVLCLYSCSVWLY